MLFEKLLLLAKEFISIKLFFNAFHLSLKLLYVYDDS